MFLLTYLRRELRRRLRQALVVALGLAVGIGLVITVMAVSSGVQDAQAAALHSLYGTGTDISVTQAPTEGTAAEPDLSAFNSIVAAAQGGIGSGQTVDAEGLIGFGSQSSMLGPGLGRLSTSVVDQIAGLPGVARAAGGVTATNLKMTAALPSAQTSGPEWQNLGGLALRTSAFQTGGVDVARGGLGPLASTRLAAGRGFTAADVDASVAVVASSLAQKNGLTVGSTITVGGAKFTVIGVVTQSPTATPAEVYVPLAKAQQLAKMGDDVNTIFVAVDDPADVGAVKDAIARIVPAATVTTSGDLAGQVSGSLDTATTLVRDVGTWLAIIVLVAAFVLAGLLTLATVSRRAGEFGLLKALGWQSRRVVGQVTGEALVQGVAGGAVGLALGIGAAGLISRLAPSLSASFGLPGTDSVDLPGSQVGGAFQQAVSSSRNVGAIELSATVTPRMIILAVLLAVAGGLVAGAVGSWRAARLRPAVAMRQVR